MSQPASAIPASQSLMRRLENAYLRRGRGHLDYELLAEARRRIKSDSETIDESGGDKP